jgi:hypothetical protein
MWLLYEREWYAGDCCCCKPIANTIDTKGVTTAASASPLDRINNFVADNSWDCNFSKENTLLYHLWTRFGPLCDVGSTFAESFLWSSWEPPIGDCLA